VTSTLSPELSETVRSRLPAADWRVVAFLVVGSDRVDGLLRARAGAAGHSPRARANVRGETSKDARPSRARNILIGIQVTASALLLIASAVFLRSALASSTVDPGVRTADTVLVEIVNEPLRVAMVRAVMAEPLVASVAASWPDTLGAPRIAFAAGSAGKSTVAYRMVSPEYFGVLDIDIVKGRGFMQDERAGTATVVVSETTSRQLWPNADAIGQVLHLEPDPNSETRRRDNRRCPRRTFTVVGVARDVPGFRLAGFKEAGIYIPTTLETAKTSLTLRVHGDPDRARRQLLDRLTTVDPGMGQVVTMRTLARMETYFLQVAFWLTLVLGGLALVLTLSGSVQRAVISGRAARARVGVRMALGATMRDIGGLVLSQSIRPVGFGVAIGAGLAAALAIVLASLSTEIGAVVRLFDPVAYAASWPASSPHAPWPR
jgi:hypothetical protein